GAPRTAHQAGLFPRRHRRDHVAQLCRFSQESVGMIDQLESLYSGVVADVLDGLGYRNQCLPSHIRPLTPLNRVAGVVFPVKAITVHEMPAKPYELEIAAVDAVQRGDVLVVDAGDDRTSAFWGELLTTACAYK